jgi:hypothetical protein
VEAASLKGLDRDQLEVKGVGIDAVKLTTLIRRKVGHALILSVAEDKKEEVKNEMTVEKKVRDFRSIQLYVQIFMVLILVKQMRMVIVKGKSSN